MHFLDDGTRVKKCCRVKIGCAFGDMREPSDFGLRHLPNESHQHFTLTIR